MRRAVGLVAAVAVTFGVGCGGDTPKAALPGPEQAPTDAPAPEPKSAAPEADARGKIDRGSARPLDPVDYWRAVALDTIAQTETDGDETFVVIKGEGAHVVESARLADVDRRSLGYREAVDALVLQLRDAGKRDDAASRLQALTKTDRGAWENWVDWYAEHGDFLVYNAELDRVEVDAQAKADGVAPAVDGLRVTLSTSDRARRGKPWTIRLDVANVSDEPLQVCTRFEVGTELELHLRRDEPKDATPVDIPGDSSPRGPELDDFVVLEPGTDRQWSADLWELLPKEPSPGQYRLRAVFHGVSLPREGSPAARVWTGQAPSLSRSVRVVEW